MEGEEEISSLALPQGPSESELAATRSHMKGVIVKTSPLRPLALQLALHCRRRRRRRRRHHCRRRRLTLASRLRGNLSRLAANYLRQRLGGSGILSLRMSVHLRTGVICTYVGVYYLPLVRTYHGHSTALSVVVSGESSENSRVTSGAPASSISAPPPLIKWLRRKPNCSSRSTSSENALNEAWGPYGTAEAANSRFFIVR